ncbi:metallophosphoesterase family protein [Sphingomonas sp. ID0503]|uniref:metallophosphoesterase family protein n=1 Tax=Sphingomonas sp. ID0503 TaxID=3399691 RepID=UPI003AFA2ACA
MFLQIGKEDSWLVAAGGTPVPPLLCVAMPTARLFHVSDLHFGREDPAALDWFAGLVRNERPDAVVITGDFTFRATKPEFAAAIAYLERLDVPLSLEPGNHDLPYYNDPLRRLFRPYRRFAKFEGRIEQPLTLSAAAIVPLKTVSRFQWRVNQSLGVVRPASLAAAMERIAAAPKNCAPIVACHHPLADIPDMAEPQHTRGGKAALAALAAAGAKAVLTGHIHDPFDRMWETAAGPIRLIGAGTLSERLRSSRPSFNEISVEEGRIENRVRTLT